MHTQLARPGAARLPGGTARPRAVPNQQQRQQQQQHLQQLWHRRRQDGAAAAASAGPRDGSGAAPSSSSPSAPSAPVTTAASSEAPRLDCVEVGMDVYCVPNDGDDGGGGSSSSAEPAARLATTPWASALRAAVLVSPFFFWGTSMVAMKGVGPHATPLLLGAMRLLPAGAVLVAWAARQGRPQPAGAVAWAWVAAFALVDGAAFQGFLAQGLERTSAGLGSVIIDSQPLTVAVLASLLFGERLGAGGVAGLALGVLGLVLLEVPPGALAGLLPPTAAAAAAALFGGAGAAAAGAAAPPSAALAAAAAAEPGGAWSVLDSGEFWMLLAAQSMAVGTVMVRYVTRHCDPVMATGWHMVLGGAALLGAALLASGGGDGGGGGDLAARLAGFTAGDAAAMLYVSMLGGAASYGVFFLEASKGNLTALSSLTFLTPMFAAAGDYVVRGATLTPLQLLGAGVALGGVALVSSGSKGGGGDGEEEEEEGGKAKAA
jgi:drug/metabolite transporter (DMT)-like permease